MNASLADSLAVLLSSETPNLLNPLFSSDAIHRLQSTAVNLPPILRGGFESRLDSKQSQVDLQQCIKPNQLELKRLVRYIENLKTSRQISQYSVWNRLQTFIKTWSASLSDIEEVWLEFDVINSLNTIPIPSLFVGFRQDPSQQDDQLACRVLDQLQYTTTQSQNDCLTLCFKACPDTVFISHIGIMDSRAETTLRVNIKRLDATSLPGYLKAIAWTGHFDEVEELSHLLFDIADRVTVCLDITDQVCPNISLECIFPGQFKQYSGWKQLLDLLVKHDLCSSNKSDALLAWPAQINPANTQQPWPAHLVAESLLKHQHCFTQFERSLSHIKISWPPQKKPQAKAYLWFQHQWINGE